MSNKDIGSYIGGWLWCKDCVVHIVIGSLHPSGNNFGFIELNDDSTKFSIRGTRRKSTYLQTQKEITH